jgi:hypothetical protein
MLVIAYLFPGGDYTAAVLGGVALVGIGIAIVQGRRRNSTSNQDGRTYMATPQSQKSMLVVSGVCMVLLLVLGGLQFHSDRSRSVLVMAIGVVGFLLCLASWEVLRRRRTS